VTVAVDDPQWLDPQSADAMQFAARRLGTEPVGLLLAQRAEEPGPAPLELDRALPGARLHRIWLGPFTLGALQHLLRSRAVVSLPRPIVARIHEASAGNPFYALEIARMIASGALQPRPGDPLPLPAGARGLVRERLEGLPAAVRRPLIVVALMARPTVPIVAAVTESEPSSWVDPAVDAGLVLVEGRRLSFTHPLFASGITDLALPEERRALHARIAEALDDPEERAVHLARSSDPPDELVADALESSARLARRRGARLAAAERFHQSFDFTPARDRAARARRAIEASGAYRDAGSGEQAVAVARQALDGAPRGRARAGLLLAMAESEVVYRDARSLLGEALAHTEPDQALRARILRFAGEVDWLNGDLASAREKSHDAAELAARAGDTETELKGLTYAGMTGTLMGAADAIELLVSAEALEPSVPELNPWDRPGHWLGVRALWLDEVDEARRRLEAEYRRSEEEGNEYDRAALCFHLTQTECRAGNLRAASRYADIGYDIATQFGGSQLVGVDCSAKAMAEAHLGNVDAARAAVDEGIRAARTAADRFFEVHLRAALAFLEVSLGNHAEAAEATDGLPELVDGMGIREPGIFPFVPDRVEGLVALGRLEEAEVLDGEWEALGRALNRPRVLATGARCRALLHAARAELSDADEALQEALSHHAGFPNALELGRTLLVRGQLLRRLKRKKPAREALERARSIFESIGAKLWTARASSELTRIGGRAPSPLELTPSERQVAEAAASGATNREVAERLFLSVNTVEATLTRVYRKLGVRSRTELARALKSQ